MSMGQLALVGVRVMVSIASGGLTYWAVIMLLTSIPDVSFGFGMALVLLSPLTIFGWLAALGFMVAAYFLLKRYCF